MQSSEPCRDQGFLGRGVVSCLLTMSCFKPVRHLSSCPPKFVTPFLFCPICKLIGSLTWEDLLLESSWMHIVGTEDASNLTRGACCGHTALLNCCLFDQPTYRLMPILVYPREVLQLFWHLVVFCSVCEHRARKLAFQACVGSLDYRRPVQWLQLLVLTWGIIGLNCRYFGSSTYGCLVGLVFLHRTGKFVLQ